MNPNASEVVKLTPEAFPAPPAVSSLAILSGSVLVMGAFGIAFSVLVLTGGPHFGHVLAGSAGFIGCAVLVASAVITLSIGGRRNASGMDVPGAVAYVVLAGGVIAMLASVFLGAAGDSYRIGAGSTWLVRACASSGGFIAGAVLVAGGLIGAAFRARNV